MKVLLVSSNRQKVQNTPLLAFPSGPAYIAGAAMEAGHQVEVFDACFVEDDVTGRLTEQVGRFDPDVIAVSIRNLNSQTRNDFRDFRPLLKEITDCLGRTTPSPIVLGGPGFWNFGAELLTYLDLDYGIRGEGELSFPAYLKRLEEGSDLTAIPGCVFRKAGAIHELPVEPVEDLDATAFPAFELFDPTAYRKLGTFPAISTKRGCAFRCTHCPRNALEGSRYRLKSPRRVVEEIERAMSAGVGNMFYFVDNFFNYPLWHAEDVCQELIDRETGIAWTADSITPLGMSEEFCRLVKESGCSFLCLSIEHGSASMLKRMRRGYAPEDVNEAARNLDRSGVPYMVTLLLGGPGETPETVSEAVGLVDRLPGAPGVLATVGLALEHNQQIVTDAIRDGQLKDDSEVFEGRFYVSSALSQQYLDELAEILEAKENWTVQGI